MKHLLLFRFACSSTAQIQLFVKTRFASFALMIESLLKYQGVLQEVVESSQYAVHASNALKRPPYCPKEDEVVDELKDAEKEMDQMAERDLSMIEVGLYNTKLCPPALEGCKKYAIVAMDVMSPKFWRALRVWLNT